MNKLNVKCTRFKSDVRNVRLIIWQWWQFATLIDDLFPAEFYSFSPEEAFLIKQNKNWFKLVCIEKIHFLGSIHTVVLFSFHSGLILMFISYAFNINQKYIKIKIPSSTKLHMSKNRTENGNARIPCIIRFTRQCDHQ